MLIKLIQSWAYVYMFSSQGTLNIAYTTKNFTYIVIQNKI